MLCVFMTAGMTTIQLDFNGEIQPLYANVVFAVYMYSYILLVCAVVFLLSILYENSLATLSFKVVLSAVVRHRLRWFVLLVFSSMAALPPSFFFLSKLGLLSSIIFFGA